MYVGLQICPFLVPLTIGDGLVGMMGPDIRVQTLHGHWLPEANILAFFGLAFPFSATLPEIVGCHACASLAGGLAGAAILPELLWAEARDLGLKLH